VVRVHVWLMYTFDPKIEYGILKPSGRDLNGPVETKAKPRFLLHHSIPRQFGFKPGDALAGI